MIPSWLNARLKETLNDWQQAGSWRCPVAASSTDGRTRIYDGRGYLNFAGNDYLGLAQHPKVKEAVVNAVRRYGWGSTGSHMVTGHYALHEKAEEAIARLTGCESALLFSTGYMANLAIAAVLLTTETEALADRLVHASIIDGLRLAQARFRRYRHLDLQHLDKLLTNDGRHKVVFTDGVFSMDGDCAPLPELMSLVQRHNAALVVDDAHGVGVLGSHGGGLVQAQGVDPSALTALTVTFGKALGGFGAAVAGSGLMIEALKQFARSYIYTTALPVAAVAAVLASIDCLIQVPQLREQLQANIQFFRDNLARMGVQPRSRTPIQPLMVGCSKRALQLSRALKADGVWVPAIRPPTVPKGTARLRITLTARHTREDIEQLLTSLWRHRHLWLSITKDNADETLR